MKNAFFRLIYAGDSLRRRIVAAFRPHPGDSRGRATLQESGLHYGSLVSNDPHRPGGRLY